MWLSEILIIITVSLSPRFLLTVFMKITWILKKKTEMLGLSGAVKPKSKRQIWDLLYWILILKK